MRPSHLSPPPPEATTLTVKARGELLPPLTAPPLTPQPSLATLERLAVDYGVAVASRTVGPQTAALAAFSALILHAEPRMGRVPDSQPVRFFSGPPHYPYAAREAARSRIFP